MTKQRATDQLDRLLALYNDADALRRFINEHGGPEKGNQPDLNTYRDGREDGDDNPARDAVKLMLSLIIEANQSAQPQAFAHMQTLPTVKTYQVQRPYDYTRILIARLHHLAPAAQLDGLKALANIPLDAPDTHLDWMADIQALLAEENRMAAIEVIKSSSAYRTMQEIDLEEGDDTAERALVSMYGALPANDPCVIFRTDMEPFKGWVHSQYNQTNQSLADQVTILRLPNKGLKPKLALNFKQATDSSGSPAETVESLKLRLRGLKADADTFYKAYYRGAGRSYYDEYQRADDKYKMIGQATLLTCQQLHKAFEDAAVAKSGDAALARALRQTGKLFVIRPVGTPINSDIAAIEQWVEPKKTKAKPDVAFQA